MAAERKANNPGVQIVADPVLNGELMSLFPAETAFIAEAMIKLPDLHEAIRSGLVGEMAYWTYWMIEERDKIVLAQDVADGKISVPDGTYDLLRELYYEDAPRNEFAVVVHPPLISAIYSYKDNENEDDEGTDNVELGPDGIGSEVFRLSVGVGHPGGVDWVARIDKDNRLVDLYAEPDSWRQAFRRRTPRPVLEIMIQAAKRALRPEESEEPAKQPPEEPLAAAF